MADGVEDDEKLGDSDSNSNESVSGETIVNATVTRFGHDVKSPEILIDTMKTCAHLEVSAADLWNLGCMAELVNEEEVAFEIILVGTGIGSGLENTNELKVMNFKEAMKSKDAKEWMEEVGNEKKIFYKFDALITVPISEEPKGYKIMTITWAMKKTAIGKFHRRLNTRGYDQI